MIAEPVNREAFFKEQTISYELFFSAISEQINFKKGQNEAQKEAENSISRNEWGKINPFKAIFFYFFFITWYLLNVPVEFTSVYSLRLFFLSKTKQLKLN